MADRLRYYDLHQSSASTSCKATNKIFFDGVFIVFHNGSWLSNCRFFQSLVEATKIELKKKKYLQCPYIAITS